MSDADGRCGAVHPDNPEARCMVTGYHPEHFDGGSGLSWENADNPPPADRRTLDSEVRSTVKRVRRHIVQSRWPEETPTSGVPRPVADHDGVTFVKALDKDRLNTQLLAVYELMDDGKWRTLSEIVETLLGNEIRATEASVSARLRDLRKPQFGGMKVERRRRNSLSGLWEYRLAGQLSS